MYKLNLPTTTALFFFLARLSYLACYSEPSSIYFCSTMVSSGIGSGGGVLKEVVQTWIHKAQSVSSDLSTGNMLSRKQAFGPY